MSPAEVIRDMYRAALDGDQERFFGYIHEDFLLHEPRYLPYAGDYRGVDGFRQLYAAATQILDLASMTVEYVFGDDERACAVIECDLVGRDDRATILEEWIVRDGMVRWGRVYWFDPAAVGAHA